ncbi:hypothetical protein B0H34DRAFT_795558 [Crassisporium funariophilum]|nr:hypothetical protein B0H34DRAFT_795558 [Crassisporium funariophilum]
MHFLILGATGPCGLLLVRKTLEVYPDSTIVIFARSPEKIPEDLKNNSSITLIKGQLTDLDVLASAVEGVDVVLSALGPMAGHPSGNPIAAFYGNLIDIMDKNNVKRIIVLATASSPDPNDKSSLVFKLLVAGVRTLAQTAYTEIVAIGELFRSAKAEHLDWTMVRVPILTNKDSEAVIGGYVGDGKTGSMLPRKAFAAFYTGEVEKREWVKKAPLISSG